MEAEQLGGAEHSEGGLILSDYTRNPKKAKKLVGLFALCMVQLSICLAIRDCLACSTSSRTGRVR